MKLQIVFSRSWCMYSVIVSLFIQSDYQFSYGDPENGALAQILTGNRSDRLTAFEMWSDHEICTDSIKFWITRYFVTKTNAYIYLPVNNTKTIAITAKLTLN